MEPQEETPFELINRFMKEFKGEINTINEAIDVKVQMEYFDISKKIREKGENITLNETIALIENDQTNIEAKKELFVKIASIDDVKAFRYLESASQNPANELKTWTIIAMQESRMLLQSKLLEQSQVLISTGLGGKGSKLRYFFALFNRSNEEFAEYQQKIIKSEFEYIFKQYNSETEEFTFIGNIVTIVALIPLSEPIQELFTRVMGEINQYGNFLREKCIITNVRRMEIEEIYEFLNKEIESTDINENEE